MMSFIFHGVNFNSVFNHLFFRDFYCLALSSDVAKERMIESVEKKFRNYMELRASRTLYVPEEFPPAADLLDVPSLDLNEKDIKVGDDFMGLFS